jgi:hypothetical protein
VARPQELRLADAVGLAGQGQEVRRRAGRLQRAPDGLVRITLKKAYADGTIAGADGTFRALPLLGNAADLPDRRRLVLRRRTEAEVIEDPPDRELVGQEGDHLHLLSAAGAEERIHLIDLGDER